MKQKNSSYAYLLISPALLLVVMVMAYPTLYSLYLGFTRTRRGVTTFIGFKNYQAIFASKDFMQSLQLTLIFVLLYVLLTVAFAFILALLFNRGVKWSAIYMTIIFLPWVLSEITSGVVWRWMFYRDYGILQNLIAPLFNNATVITTPAGAMGVVIAASVWRSTAFAMLLILAGLQTVPKEIYEAASIDGATGWQSFWQLTWPLVLPTTMVTIVFLTIQAVNNVGMFLSITNGGPGRATEVLSLHMYREAIEFFNFGYGAALSVILFLINLALAFIYIRSLQRESALAAA
jgi:multiple sugar transport system permease protein